ncbi:MAG: hypothetical protein US57_C0016G0022 [Candidatus Moranbacteria bacterium GW2011_GWC2_37_73]|nr:MAG: hypothetical protein UR95_C0002G0005 [Parcubacteria group bacterium GW2011_GWC1_36_108]KKQ00225.1 MAG: hypothetical protein US09_C0017G0012 [Candidatus Moranbacteria bacterium GW2011_GWD1_36_198]KKQ00332.1 MAG: hypothetical protein US10_C0034G0002 [Candidatus Moranbacteria bacterium GW2011_GWD2_36_198]KKQ39267.1 MAG: hypothetical protein US57_C0016G0022 [Candidatus Moranbacteria bacterium GW2011_GWC2_37_73]HAR99604.1 hypothetical protein [Candidatus Moranbacteria bacterium]
MFKIKQKTKKIFSTMLVFSLIFVEMFPIGVYAIELDEINAASFFGVAPIQIEKASELYEKFMNKTDVDAYAEKYAEGPINGTENQIQGIMYKQDVPKVDVTFSAEGGGTAGSIMTATALPSFFKADPKNLYFTWYLKRGNCGLPSSDKPGDVESCDEDSDGKITENDWKIAAAKIIVAGDFNAKELDENGNKKISYASSSVDDKAAGYDAPVPRYCYARDSAAGIDYELTRVEELFKDDACPAGTKLSCAKSGQQETCTVLNPAYVEADYQANLAAIAEAQAWNADPANALDQHIVPEPYAISKTIERTTNKFCEVANEDYFCKISSENDFKNYQASVDCYDGETAMCVADSGNTLFPTTAPHTAVIFAKDNLCSSLEVNPNSPAVTPPVPAWLNAQASAFNAVANQSCSSALAVTEATGTCTFEKTDENLCQHLFAQLPSSMSDETGDGKFTLAEKEFWGTDPTKTSTNGKGKDEENVVGLGVDKFSWMFSPGDQVGVVIEGDSAFPTEHADSSYKRTWAFSKNTCEAIEKLSDDELVSGAKGESNKNKRGGYLEGPGGKDCPLNDKSKCTGFFTAEIDLNECLEENLLEPLVDGVSKFGIKLVTSPENPINDPDGRGDILKVSTVTTNTQNQKAVLYKWSVQKSTDGGNPPINTTSWFDITTAMEKSGAFSAADASGLGKKELAINLNVSDEVIKSGWSENKKTAFDKNGVFYLKIKVSVIGGAVDGSQEAAGFAIVRVTQQQDKIQVYPVTAGENGMLSISSGDNPMPDCDGTCVVSKNQIVAVKVPISTNTTTVVPFEWTVNSNPIYCDATISTQCDLSTGSQGNILFFPIVGNVGEAIDIVARGLKNGEAITVSKHFVIGEMGAQIKSADYDNAWPKLLGYAKDLTGNKYPDYSNNVLETYSGKEVTLLGQAGYNWTVDGQEMLDYVNQDLQITIDKLAGESYNVGLLIDKDTAQSKNNRMALYRNWGISPYDSTEENQNADIQLNVIANPNQAMVDSKSNFFGASLITHLPAQLFFLLKISLTSILLLLATGLLFSFIPETLFRKEK